MLQQKYLYSIYLFGFSYLFWQQKQPPQVFCKKDVLKNFRNVYRKTSALDSLFNKVAGLKVTALIKKGLHHSCFPLSQNF